MRLLVVSDLHIWGPEDPVYHSLLKLIRSHAKPADDLVLAGDIFDLFVGNKGVYRQRYSEFFTALREAGDRGVRLHYIEGNHDFLIRRAFAKIPGLRVYPHEVKLEIGGKRIFVAHGDTVDQKDLAYRALRLFFRSPLMKGLVLAMPGRLLDRIGRKSSETSRAAKPVLASEMPIERAQYLRKCYRSYAAERLAEGYDFVVMGHCHDLDEMRFKVGDRQGQYVNVGYPRIHGSFLTWAPGEKEITREPMPPGP